MKFCNIQALRMIAAMLVVIGHSAAFGLIVPGSVNIHLICYSGVDIFFVISGFIISLVATEHESHPGVFIAKRIGRVFPVYWIVLIISIIVSQWITIGSPWINQLPNVPVVNYFLLLTVNNKFVPSAWSMAYEIYFYAWMGLILLITPRRFWESIIILLLIQMSFIIYIFITKDKFDTSVFNSFFIFEFGLGCLVAWVYRRRYLNFILLALVVSIVGFVTGMFVTARSGFMSSLSRLLTFGIGSAGLIYTLIVCELSNFFRFPRFTQMIGDVSYSIYLWHMLILTIVVHLFSPDKINIIWIRNTYGVLCIIFVIGLSFFSYRIIEKPAMRATQLLINKNYFLIK